MTTRKLNLSTAIDTAKFIEIVNNMFDSGNSKNLHDPNPNRRPMSNCNLKVLGNLHNARKLFQNAVKI